ncbi:ImcF-related family protein [uncultured Shimia sp.]|uniref:ImcF-related family protein n=1 Tax=uncultured Shimia sp. TaxID=573152 RepID=UPI00262CCB2D|nr:ImcF-related family protein [uncultured Shimia sp.]
MAKAGRENTNAVTVYQHAARPVLDWTDTLERRARQPIGTLVTEAERELEQFEARLVRAQVQGQSIKPARYALAVLMDGQVRQTPGIDLGGWSVLAHRQLFEGRDMTVARIRDFEETAAHAGDDYSDLAIFLKQILALSQERRHGHKAPDSGSWGWRIIGSVMLLVAALIGYAAFFEYKFQRDLRAGFEDEVLSLGLDRPQAGAELVARLDQMQAALVRVQKAAERAPLKRRFRLPVLDSETYAQRAYSDVVARQVPPAIADAIETIVATEGDGLVLYDTLRAWVILTGEDEWQTTWLAGWLRDHTAALGVGGLARHVAPLAGPIVKLAPSDAVLMDQARAFAAEVAESDRTWLELKRAPETVELSDWHPEQAVPLLADVMVRRSGQPVTEPIPGIYTAEGWLYARNFGIGVAVQKARAIGPIVTEQVLTRNNKTPDLLANRLQEETIAVWQNWLADLRVRPFSDRDAAIIVSGALSQANNPLSQVLRAVFVEAGGGDRRRSHEQQLALARIFGPTIQYLDQGRMVEMARLFSSLNVALGAADSSQKQSNLRLMSVQDRARSISALNAAPAVVAQLTEDVLVQSGMLDASDEGGNALTRAWQRSVFPLCQQTIKGRYPFGAGADVALADVVAMFGPQGVMAGYLTGVAGPYLETGQSPWRWKPEARFAGVSPESAAYLERAAVISEALFDENGKLRQQVTLSALAELGQTLVAFGGEARPVRAQGEPVALVWPGPQPELGVEVSFRESADAARLQKPGPWGLLRLVDSVRLRLRDEGQRALLDLRTESGRVFLSLTFHDEINPVSARRAILEFPCPPAL